MGERLEQLGEAVVALVTFTRQRNLAGYRSRLHLPYPVLSDESRSVYQAYGLGRAHWWRAWGVSTLREYGRLLGRRDRRGVRRRLRRPTEDVRQLGGDFVIGGDGRLRYAYRSKNPADRPPVDDIVAAALRG